jgi:hypothetical protein
MLSVKARMTNEIKGTCYQQKVPTGLFHNCVVVVVGIMRDSFNTESRGYSVWEI